MGDEIHIDLISGTELYRDLCKCFISHVIYHHRKTAVAATQIMQDGSEVLIRRHPQYDLVSKSWKVRCPDLTFRINTHDTQISEPPTDRDYHARYLQCPRCDRLLMYHDDVPADLAGTIKHVESCAWEASEINRATGEVLFELQRKHWIMTTRKTT